MQLQLPDKRHFAQWFFRLGKAWMILLLLTSQAANAQLSSSIKGLVENEQGESLQAVTVVLKRGVDTVQRSTVTDAAGMFSFSGLAAGGPYVITVSYVGYETQVINRAKLNEGKEESILISLKATNNSMQTVVVVGYGTQRKKDITGAVSSVSRDRLEKVPNLNIGQVLQGSIPGFMVQQTGAGAASSEELM